MLLLAEVRLLVSIPNIGLVELRQFRLNPLKRISGVSLEGLTPDNYQLEVVRVFLKFEMVDNGQCHMHGDTRLRSKLFCTELVKAELIDSLHRNN